MTAKPFASTADLSAKQISFTEVGPGLYAYTAEGDPNSGIIVGDDCCMVIDAQATPAMAQGVIDRVRHVTTKPIKYVVLSHYHAVRVLGASAYQALGIIASNARLASSPPAASASVRTRGVICHERPQRSLHQPHWLSAPPFPTIAFQ